MDTATRQLPVARNDADAMDEPTFLQMLARVQRAYSTTPGSGTDAISSRLTSVPDRHWSAQ